MITFTLPAFPGALDTVYHVDALALLAALPDASVDCVVTSPPYYGLRNYKVDGQIGLEDTPQAYVARLAELFREVRRVLKDTGTCWINLGDSYVGATSQHRDGGSQGHNNLAMKQLIGIPWRVAFALQDDGWILRSDIIWHKPNPMPESVTDRPTKAHEYVFLLAKEPRYYYDAEAIKERAVNGDPTSPRGSEGVIGSANGGRRDRRAGKGRFEYSGKYDGSGDEQRAFVVIKEFRNKRSVWTVPTKPNPEAHFATYPDELITPMILAGCPPGGVVLDPFMGSGTTALVARKLGRRFVGSELNPDYVAIANKRLSAPYTPSFMALIDAAQSPEPSATEAAA